VASHLANSIDSPGATELAGKEGLEARGVTGGGTLHAADEGGGSCGSGVKKGTYFSGGLAVLPQLCFWSRARKKKQIFRFMAQTPR
jgi:hypothetical protein